MSQDLPEWVKRVYHAEARLVCNWPRLCPPRILRGAVIAEMDRLLPHGAGVDWHQHGDDDKSAQRIPRIFYRVLDGQPSLWAWGPRAHQHLAQLTASLHALRLPQGQVVEIEGVDLDTQHTDVQYTGKSWYQYELVTPIYPSDVAFKRRPRQCGPQRKAWGGSYLTAAINRWVKSAGLNFETRGQLLHVSVDEAWDVPVIWERPDRGTAVKAVGFRARWTCNAILPDGLGLGHHRAEGFGEVRRCKY